MMQRARRPDRLYLAAGQLGGLADGQLETICQMKEMINQMPLNKLSGIDLGFSGDRLPKIS